MLIWILGIIGFMLISGVVLSRHDEHRNKQHRIEIQKRARRATRNFNRNP